MGKWRILIAGVIGLATVMACRVGFFAANSIYMAVGPNVMPKMLIPVGVLLVLVLGLGALKYKREYFSYFALVATVGITGTVCGLTLLVLRDWLFD